MALFLYPIHIRSHSQTKHSPTHQNASSQRTLLFKFPSPNLVKGHHVSSEFDDSYLLLKGKFQTLSKLVKADVSRVTIMGSQILVRIFCNAEFLRLDEYCDIDIPVFPNLIHLELIFGFYVQWKSVLNMLNHCPQLQTFVFENKHWSVYDRIWPNTHVAVPECFSSQLRTCVFRDFTGRECEMRFIKFVMQNASLLRTITIFTEIELRCNEEKQAEISKELAHAQGAPQPVNFSFCNFYAC